MIPPMSLWMPGALVAAALLVATPASAQTDGGAPPPRVDAGNPRDTQRVPGVDRDAGSAALAVPPLQDAGNPADTRRAPYADAGVDNALPPGVAMDRPNLTAAQEARYQEGLRHYQQRRYDEAIRVYMDLARENNCCGVLGMVVASLASTAPTASRAAEAARDADAHPGDVLKQYVAGVLAHYAAHVNGRTTQEKATLYTQAIRYLERTLPAFEHEPRVFIYLAVSHFRLGHQDQAERFIERAVELAAHDPDAYYCRAEIFQRTNVQRSIRDIDTYLRINAQNEARGAVGDPGKTERVRMMRAHLIDVAAGRAQPRELFDPVAEQRRNDEGSSPEPAEVNDAAQPSAAPTARRSNTGQVPPRRSPVPYALGALAVAAVGWAVGHYSRRGKGGSKGDGGDQAS